MSTNPKPIPQDKATELLVRFIEDFDGDVIAVDAGEASRILQQANFGDYTAFIKYSGGMVTFNKNQLLEDAGMLDSPFRKETIHPSSAVLRPYYAAAEPRYVGGYRVLEASRMPAPEHWSQGIIAQAWRKEPVYEWIAQPGDKVTVSLHTSDKRSITAAGGEHVFIKRQGEGAPPKIYIPLDGSGPLSDAVLNEKYTPAMPCHLREDDPLLHSVPVGRTLTIRLPHRDTSVAVLHHAMTEKTIILNARGPGMHQHHEPGDSLKYEEGQWVGVSAAEITNAWEINTKQNKAR